MGIQQEVTEAVDEILTVAWNERDGEKVPETDDVVLKNGAVNVSATYLYADLADSSGLAQNVNRRVAARIIRGYLNSAARVIRKWGGAIRSYDGDRVMGIFIGDYKNNHAARAALGINWAFTDVMKPRMREKWPKLEADDLWDMDHGIGVATGKAMIVRGGVVGQNDLVSIGEAPNIAAKLSDIRSTKTIYITDAVHGVLADQSSKSSGGQDFWVPWPDQTIGNKKVRVYASSWWKKP